MFWITKVHGPKNKQTKRKKEKSGCFGLKTETEKEQTVAQFCCVLLANGVGFTCTKKPKKQTRYQTFLVRNKP